MATSCRDGPPRSMPTAPDRASVGRNGPPKEFGPFILAAERPIGGRIRASGARGHEGRPAAPSLTCCFAHGRRADQPLRARLLAAQRARRLFGTVFNSAEVRGTGFSNPAPPRGARRRLRRRPRIGARRRARRRRPEGHPARSSIAGPASWSVAASTASGSGESWWTPEDDSSAHAANRSMRSRDSSRRSCRHCRVTGPTGGPGAGGVGRRRRLLARLELRHGPLQAAQATLLVPPQPLQLRVGRRDVPLHRPQPLGRVVLGERAASARGGRGGGARPSARATRPRSARPPRRAPAPSSPGAGRAARPAGPGPSERCGSSQVPGQGQRPAQDLPAADQQLDPLDRLLQLPGDDLGPPGQPRGELGGGAAAVEVPEVVGAEGLPLAEGEFVEAAAIDADALEGGRLDHPGVIVVGGAGRSRSTRRTARRWRRAHRAGGRCRGRKVRACKSLRRRLASHSGVRGPVLRRLLA